MSNKRKYVDDDSPEREIKCSKYDHQSVKKHSLDSDEEDSDEEKKAHYDILDTDDIEGQEDGISGVDGEIKIMPFNMKEELEEGHFDTEGNFHWNKEKTIRDNWQENIDWMKVKELGSSYKEKDYLEESMDSLPGSPFDQIAIYKQILEFMEPGETILKTLRRLGGNKSLSASERLKRKKAGLCTEDKGDSSKVTALTELANKLLTKTGNMDIYQESYQYIKKMVLARTGMVRGIRMTYVKTEKDIRNQIKKIDSAPGSSKYNDALDMYADDFDEKEKERIEQKTAEGTSNDSSESNSTKEILMWEYKIEKNDDKIQGPHTTEQMQKYVDEGFFKGEVWVRKVGQDGPFYSSRRIDFQLYL